MCCSGMSMYLQTWGGREHERGSGSGQLARLLCWGVVGLAPPAAQSAAGAFFAPHCCACAAPNHCAYLGVAGDLVNQRFAEVRGIAVCGEEREGGRRGSQNRFAAAGQALPCSGMGLALLGCSRLATGQHHRPPSAPTAPLPALTQQANPAQPLQLAQLLQQLRQVLAVPPVHAVPAGWERRVGAGRR